MLAAGTWILPVHTLAAPVAVAPTGGEGDDLSTFAEIAEELSDWIASGELAFGPRFDSSLDRDGDGVHDVTCVSSGDLLASGGTIAVLDGATSALRFLMQPPSENKASGRGSRWSTTSTATDAVISSRYLDSCSEVFRRFGIGL